MSLQHPIVSQNKEVHKKQMISKGQRNYPKRAPSGKAETIWATK